MKDEDEIIPKVSPIACLRHFLNQYSPTCNDKYIHLYQVVELFNKPDVKNPLQSFGCNIHPNGDDTSHQNGLVEQYHRILANSIRYMLTGYNLNIKFWPYDLYHAIIISKFLFRS